MAHLLRRLALHLLFALALLLSGFGLYQLAASGFDGFPTGPGYAQMLATGISFSIIAPAAAWVLWRLLARRLEDPDAPAAEQRMAQLLFSLQASVVYTAALATAAVSCLRLLSSLVLDAADWQHQAGLWLGFSAVFAVQAALLQRHRPAVLPHLAESAGWAFTLVLLIIAGARALALSLHLVATPGMVLSGPPDLQRLAGELVWLAGAGGLWWWHWILLSTSRRRDAAAGTLMMLVAVVLPAATATVGAGLMAGGFWDWQPALAAVAACSISWFYHQPRLPRKLRRAAWQLLSGLGVALAASGLGMAINALLAGGEAGLLRTGTVFLLLGLLVWVRFFRHLRRGPAGERRVYLVLFFAISALTALISLLLAGYRLVQYLLVPPDGGLLDEIRQPASWLIATALVASYHYLLWRKDRENAPATPRQRRRLVLVSPAGCEQLLKDLSGSLEIQWIKAAGSPLDQLAVHQLHAALSTRLEETSGPMLVVASAVAPPQFTLLEEA